MESIFIVIISKTIKNQQAVTVDITLGKTLMETGLG